jgi:hypothetical protein
MRSLQRVVRLLSEYKNNKKQNMLRTFVELVCSVGGFRAMSVKIKVKNSRGTRVEVKVRRPTWQQFLNY